MHPFKLATLLTDDGPVPAIGVDEVFHVFGADLRSKYPTLKAVFEDWDAAFVWLSTFADTLAADEHTGGVCADGANFDMPYRFPNKLIAAGANYEAHLAEMGLPVTRYDPMPIYFMPPTTCMVGPGRTVVKPKTTEKFDWELELTVVIGSRLKDASMEEAARAIAGYTIALDMSARDLIQIGAPFHVDLVRGKAQDTMSPIGPAILPAAFLRNPRGLPMKLWVNDQLMIDANTSDMIFEIAEILAHISKYITLEPADMVLTGSPEGSAVQHGRFLRGGDVIRASIGPIGELEVEVSE